MHWNALPEADAHLAPAFADEQSARAWLAALPRADPLPALTAISEQIRAIDAAILPADTVLALLALLRRNAVPLLSTLEARYQRKPLPLPADDAACFALVSRFWQTQAIAWLRRIPQLAPGERTLPLHRAASALRLAQLAHFQAAREMPLLLDRLPFLVLAQGIASQQLHQPLADPDFPHVEASTVGGQLAWCFLLRAVDPYRLSAAQLTVTHRAFSRWRELAELTGSPEKDAHCIDLSRLYGGQLPIELPRWLDFHKVLRKLRQRRDALQAGATPESLKLGRELSTAACLRLIKTLDGALCRPARARPGGSGELSLVFGAASIFALFTGQPFNPQAPLAPGSATLAHQRVALFGFDRVDHLPTTVRKLEIPDERWILLDGIALRPPEYPGQRRQSPCLLARRDDDGTPRLGRLQAMQCAEDGTLSAEPEWYAQEVTAAHWQPATRGSRPLPAFLLGDAREDTLILPATAGLSLPVEINLDGPVHRSWQLLEVVERGVDFVRYSAVMK